MQKIIHFVDHFVVYVYFIINHCVLYTFFAYLSLIVNIVSIRADN